MRFAKYHGLGNDFLVVDLRAAAPDEAAAIQAPASVIALCDRQFGVGGDGVLAILPSAIGDARMRVLNSDGSEAEMCGNGLRCVVRELYERGGLKKAELAIETGAGRLVCQVDDSGAVFMVTVAMGAPRMLRSEIPMAGPPGERCIEQLLALGGAAAAPQPPPTRTPGTILPSSQLAIEAPRPVTCVSMGNPHAVAFVRSRDEALELARTAGPLVERHAWFPRRTNAEFAHVKDRGEIDLVVWERGCGITLACGTGACATAVAAVVTGRADEGAPIRVNLPGGSLEITVASGLSGVAMKGPALHVFDGELDLARLAARPS